MQKQSIVIEPHETIKEFRLYLYERENAKATIDKYLTDVNTFYKFLNHNYEISKQRVLEYKEWLQRHYAVSSANSMLAALSQFLEFLGVSSMKVKRIKVQRQMILQEDQLLSEEEYHTLAKQVLLAIGSPCIHMVSHGAGRSDGVNGSYLGKRIRYVCGSLITVHRLKHFVFCHERNSSYYSSLYLTRRLSAL